MADQSIQTPQRSIWIFGNPDKTHLGFPSPGDLTDYIKSKIFDEENGRYRYTQPRNADIIVLSRGGWAYGHFTVAERVRPLPADKNAYPRVKWVYLINSSCLYKSRVRLSIHVGQYGKKITETEFEAIFAAAGGTDNHNSLPHSTVALERVLREVRQRLGQTDFRKALITAYNSRCAVTGCDAVEALEAAHIDPYSGIESNHPSNGLLLRADIHTLFDQKLVAINPQTLTVALSPGLKKTKYAELEGKALALPAQIDSRPDAAALLKRWKEFA